MSEPGEPNEPRDPTSPPTFALHFHHEIDAPRIAVWSAWTDPEKITHWHRPDSSWKVPVAELDLREGGSYCFGLEPPGRPVFYEVGIFREVRPPQRLVYTLRFQGSYLHEVTREKMEDYGTLVSVAFAEVAKNRTRILITHEGYRSERDRARHVDDWPRFLDQLANYCAGGSTR